MTTSLTLMGICNVYRITHIEIEEYSLQLLGCIIDDNLLIGARIVHNLLYIMVAYAHIVELTLADSMTRIAIIDILRSTHNIPYGTSIELH
jgi:hypothetical protein